MQFFKTLAGAFDAIANARKEGLTCVNKFLEPFRIGDRVNLLPDIIACGFRVLLSTSRSCSKFFFRASWTSLGWASSCMLPKLKFLACWNHFSRFLLLRLPLTFTSLLVYMSRLFAVGGRPTFGFVFISDMIL